MRTTDSAGADPGLSARDQQILDFEREWWTVASSKEEGIRAQFGLSTTRYYQVLNTLIDTPAAMAYDPLLVKGQRRLREARQQARSARRLGADAGPGSPKES